MPSEWSRVLNKLTDPERALELFAGGDPFATMPMEPTMRFDTTRLAPAEAAALIAAHYALPMVEAVLGPAHRESPAPGEVRSMSDGGE